MSKLSMVSDAAAVEHGSAGSRLAQGVVYASVRARRAGRRLVLVRDPSRVQAIDALSGACDLVEIVDLPAGESGVQMLLGIAHAEQAA